MNKIHDLVYQNNLREAIDYLLSYSSIGEEEKNDIILLAGQLTEIERNEICGTESLGKIRKAKTKIAHSILFFESKFKRADKLDFQPDNTVSDFDLEDFIGFGNEPGWSLRVSRQNIIFVSDYGEKTHAYEITKSFIKEDIWHFRSDKPLFNEQMYISITITKEKCNDDMSDLVYPFRVELTENLRYFTGVGQIRKKPVIQ